jgi:hypothetical protein
MEANRSMCDNLRTYKYLHRRCCDREVIIAAWKKLRKGKSTRREVIKIEADFDYYVDKMQRMIQETRPGGDPGLQFWPEKHKARVVFEHGKEREIFCPTIWEQWVHHIVIQVLAPIVTRYAYKYSCGSMPKRGGIYGKRQMERLINRGFKYFAKLDIRHFFKSVRQDIVIEMLEELICDEWFIYLVRRIFWQFPKSLPLGFYPSQWLANFVLWKLDRRIVSTGVDHIRYVDDLVLVSNNKRTLHRVVGIIRQELGKIRLRLKGNFQICRFIFRKKTGELIGRAIDFMGFVFRRDRTVLRKKIMIRATRFAGRLKRTRKIATRQALSMMSRIGWFKHTSTSLVWKTYIEPCVNVKVLKGIISKAQKEAAHENTMDHRDGLRTLSGTVCSA